MATFDTTESRLWLDTVCVSCKGNLRAPVSVYGHLLADIFTSSHVCQVEP